MMNPVPTSTDSRISTLLIANRGEIAVRVIRAARELGVRTVAIYADGDERALHTRLADEAWRIPSSLPIPYLDGEAILDLAARTGTSAIHPGYGFLAENAGFARACTEAGLIFVGPSAAAIAAMGDKIEARRIAASGRCTGRRRLGWPGRLSCGSARVGRTGRVSDCGESFGRRWWSRVSCRARVRLRWRWPFSGRRAKRRVRLPIPRSISSATWTIPVTSKCN